MKYILPWLTLLLSSCSQNYSISTNLDKKNFEEYFAANHVTIYQSAADLPKQQQLVGIVEGYDCQVKPHHASPDNIRARSDARKKAHELNANAIIFSQCSLIEDAQCHAMLMCLGNAYQVIPEQQE